MIFMLIKCDGGQSTGCAGCALAAGNLNCHPNNGRATSALSNIGILGGSAIIASLYSEKVDRVIVGKNYQFLRSGIKGNEIFVAMLKVHYKYY